MKPISWGVAVLIPARNEELLLPRCLESVLMAIGHLPDAVEAQVVLVSDSSSDRTSRIATHMLGTAGEVLSTGAGSVGIARAMATSRAIEAAGAPLHRLWLANTDADCIVPPRWLSDQLALAMGGADAIAGVVSVDSFEEHDSGVPERFRTSYFIGTDGAHPHVHGANMGIRADWYLRAGGWSELQTAEDHDIWGRLRKAGARTLSTARIYVVTSGRREGRAPHGFAGALAAHNMTPALA